MSLKIGELICVHFFKKAFCFTLSRRGEKKIGKDVFGLAGMTVWLLVFVTWSVIYNVECDKKLCCQCERTRCFYLLSLSFN